MALYPLIFEPVYQEYLWGGSRMRENWGRPFAPFRVAESWEISDRVEGMSRVVQGPLKGRTLHDLVVEFGPRLLGSDCRDSRFPLLVKIIDAKDVLSLQVHPNEEKAKNLKGEPKNEMWYFLEGGPIFAGLNQGVSSKELQEAISNHSVIDLIRRIDVKAGDAVFIPAGQIHAVGQGCLILEIQQNSNSTYRIYDWDRVDVNGNKRELHLAKALECIKWDADHITVNKSELLEETNGFKRLRVIATPFFSAEKIEIANRFLMEPDSKTFQIIFYLSGKNKGLSCLLPAVSEPLIIEGPAEVLRIF